MLDMLARYPENVLVSPYARLPIPINSDFMRCMDVRIRGGILQRISVLEGRSDSTGQTCLGPGMRPAVFPIQTVRNAGIMRQAAPLLRPLYRHVTDPHHVQIMA